VLYLLTDILFVHNEHLFSAVTSSEDDVVRVGSVIRALARALYSTCPTNGARIVATVSVVSMDL
jgi:aspartate/tyrosine/aromatic aminotransferase